MKTDQVLTLLRDVKSGAVSIDDARTALEGVSLSEEQYESAIEHGVFTKPKVGTVVRATISPAAESWLMVLFFIWGIFWTTYWSFTLTYGLLNGWDQQQLAFHLGMTFMTLIMMGIIYLRFVLPDLVVVKH
ncbi:MAG: hypothetical protein VX804_00340, partial [Candidatus Thermoplasmatota archaeon]|nr:hypothetical protein [Candidatus Thermoplasmatota archaeon]